MKTGRLLERLPPRRVVSDLVTDELTRRNSNEGVFFCERPADEIAM